MSNVLITGANRGVGLALTELFSKDNTVYAVCRSEFPSGSLNDNIRVSRLDLANESQIKLFVEQLDKDKVAIDLLINNAGVAGGSSDGIDSDVVLDLDTVKNVFTTNVVAPMTLTRHLTAALKRSKNPCVISISSRMGTRALLNEYNAHWWPYSASKAALSFAVSAFALNEPSIKFISIHPGWVKTRMGGSDAPMDVKDSAGYIKKLYLDIDSLESGKMYNYDGTPMDW